MMVCVASRKFIYTARLPGDPVAPPAQERQVGGGQADRLAPRKVGRGRQLPLRERRDERHNALPHKVLLVRGHELADQRLVVQAPALRCPIDLNFQARLKVL